jgi:hypothetical protein
MRIALLTETSYPGLLQFQGCILTTASSAAGAGIYRNGPAYSKERGGA